jgi:hypothetical protein
VLLASPLLGMYGITKEDNYLRVMAGILKPIIANGDVIIASEHAYMRLMTQAKSHGVEVIRIATFEDRDDQPTMLESYTHVWFVLRPYQMRLVPRLEQLGFTPYFQGEDYAVYVLSRTDSIS